MNLIMKINTSSNFNTKLGAASSRIQPEFSPSFSGVEKIRDGIFQKAGDGIKKNNIKGAALNFFKKHFTQGYDVTYDNYDKIIKALKENFGDTFYNCFDEIDFYNSILQSKAANYAKDGFMQNKTLKNKLVYKVNQDKNTITFHKDPFMKNVWSNIKEFFEGSILDLCVAARKSGQKFKGVLSNSPANSKTRFGKVLDTRIAQKEAQDSFYRLSGVFEQVTRGLSNKSDTIGENAKNLAKNSVGMASRKVGKYNTKTERAWNRLGTGFVSACFAATDFYNISMLQNDDPKKANEAGRKRFLQDIRRQSLTAGITYVILGALQKSVNNSIFYAALSLGGVTLLSEVLSRKMGGISLKPLSPEEAKYQAEKKEAKRLKKALKNGENPNPGEAIMPPLNTNKAIQYTINPVFDVFTDKINSYMSHNENPASFGENAVQNEPGLPDGVQNKNEQKSNENKDSLGKKFLKFALGAIGVSLGVGFIRSKNIFKIDDIIKTISKKYDETVQKITTRPVIMAKQDVDSFFDYLKKNNFIQQNNQLKNALNNALNNNAVQGKDCVIKKIGKNTIDPENMYYNLGRSEARGRKVIFNVLMYPVNTARKLLKNGNNIIKNMFNVKSAPAKEQTITQDCAAAFIEKYATKYKNAVSNNDLPHYQKELEDAFTRHFSEANSQNKNTSIAMISRFLITIISGYFFVNDYRNQVLIESKGKDVERANSTMRERIGHKISNFFLNSMFMDLFNSTFENIYLGSVPGAVGVAMATEFTNESAVRASICTPRKKMNRQQLIEYEDKHLNNKGIKGKYYRKFMELTGKKPLSEKAKSEKK